MLGRQLQLAGCGVARPHGVGQRRGIGSVPRFRGTAPAGPGSTTVERPRRTHPAPRRAPHAQIREEGQPDAPDAETPTRRTQRTPRHADPHHSRRNEGIWELRCRSPYKDHGSGHYFHTPEWTILPPPGPSGHGLHAPLMVRFGVCVKPSQWPPSTGRRSNFGAVAIDAPPPQPFAHCRKSGAGALSKVLPSCVPEVTAARTQTTAAKSRVGGSNTATLN